MNYGATYKGKNVTCPLLMNKQYFRRFKKRSDNESLQLAGFDTALFDELQSEFVVKEICKGLGMFSRCLFDWGLVEISMRLSNVSVSQWKYPNFPVQQIIEVRTSNRLFRLNGLVRSESHCLKIPLAPISMQTLPARKIGLARALMAIFS